MRFVVTLLSALLGTVHAFSSDEGDGDAHQCGAPTLLGEKAGVRVYSIESFLSDSDCIALLTARQRFMQSVEVNPPLICFQSATTMAFHKVNAWDLVDGTLCANATTSAMLLSDDPPNNQPMSYSTSLSFYPNSGNPIADAFSARAASIGAGLPYGELLHEDRGGKLQATHYSEGQGYGLHTDCTLGGKDKRDRAVTVIVYLEDTDLGGETVFLELGITVRPKRGAAIIFNSMDRRGTCLNASAHHANPVIGVGATKAIAQRWYYFEAAPGLGRRVAEPDLPPRPEGTAKVQCDEAGANFCRLYNEWGHGHLLEYRKRLGLTKDLPVSILSQEHEASVRASTNNKKKKKRKPKKQKFEGAAGA